MKQLIPGVQTEEFKDRAIAYVVFSPGLGIFSLVFFSGAFLFFFLGFGSSGFWELTFLVLLIYLPFLYMSLSLILNRTIIELTNDSVTVRYKMPHWFTKTFFLPANSSPFQLRIIQWTSTNTKTNTRTTHYNYEIIFESGTSTGLPDKNKIGTGSNQKVKVTHFGYRPYSDAVIAYLNKELTRLRKPVPVAGMPGPT